MSVKRKVLYVDDEWINLKVFSITFEEKYEILIAESGKEGLELLSKHRDIVIVFTDLRMPIMDGIEFVMQAKPLYPNIRYNLLTGFEKTPEIEDALNSGLLNKYFSKPFNKVEVLKELESL